MTQLACRTGVLAGGLLAVGVLAPAAQAPRTLKNTIGMEFVYVPPGSCLMGTVIPTCPADDPRTPVNEAADCLNQVATDETPQRQVTISRGFYLGRYEVTQGEWTRVMGKNPSVFTSEKVGEAASRHPVERVSWNDAQEFLRRLNALQPGHRLPSEAEWEYAARAGSQARWSWGDDASGADGYAWHGPNSGGSTRPVGQKKPNAWGLFDMAGNVREWVQDWYHKTYAGAPPDGRAWESPAGDHRVLRGGAWYGSTLRVADRFIDMPARTHGTYGFRVARDAR